MWYESIVPTVRLMLRIGVSIVPFAALERRRGELDEPVVEPCRGRGSVLDWRRATSAGIRAYGIRGRIEPGAFQCAMPFFVSSSSGRPMSSSSFRTPAWAISRALLGDEEEVVTTCSRLPSNLRRSTGSCVATPTGQVLRWHLRIMMQPSTPAERWRSRTRLAQSIPRRSRRVRFSSGRRPGPRSFPETG